MMNNAILITTLDRTQIVLHIPLRQTTVVTLQDKLKVDITGYVENYDSIL